MSYASKPESNLKIDLFNTLPTISIGTFAKFKRDFEAVCGIEGEEIMNHIRFGYELPVPAATVVNPFPPNTQQHFDFDRQAYQERLLLSSFETKKSKLISFLYMKCEDSLKSLIDAKGELEQCRRIKSLYRFLNFIERCCAGNTGATMYRSLVKITRLECAENKLVDYHTEFSNLLREIELLGRLL